MVLTYEDIQNRVMRMLDETAAGSPTTLALVKDFINSAHAQRVMEYPWEFALWPREVTFSTSASQRQYVLHEEFGRPLYIRNNTTKSYMEEVPLRELPADEQDWNNDTGDAWHFFYAGIQPVTFQPSSASTVSIVSSAASDDTGVNEVEVVVVGENSSGHVISETLVANGTATVTSTSSFQSIISVTKSDEWVGTMTFAIGGVTALTLLPTQVEKQYRTIQLVELPSSAQTIGYRFFRRVRPLVENWDLPLLPAPWSEILIWDTLMMMGSYLTESNPQSLSLWASKQSALERSMYQALANDGQTLEARPHYVRYMDAGRDDPRVIRN